LVKNITFCILKPPNFYNLIKPGTNMGKYQSWACAEGSNLVRTVAVLVQKDQISCIAGLFSA
jgi:hypothetical protein